MRTHLRLFYFLFFGLLCCTGSYAQLTYNDGFEGTSFWVEDEFEYAVDAEFSCTGEGFFIGNFYHYFDNEAITATATSNLIGTSNGLPITFSYSYRLLDWNNLLPVPNTPNWGSVVIQYGSSASGPWTTFETLTPAGHVASENCATKSVVFTPPAGNVFFRVFCQPGTPANEDEYIDALLFLDNLSAIQAGGACTGAPAASTTIASQPQVCTTSPVSLSLGTSYASFGSITYQWQSSPDGVTFTNVASGGTSVNYSTVQQAATWYRAIITCTASSQSTTSTPVQVGSTGLPCFCTVTFNDDVEPITLVNFAGINNSSSAVVDGTPGTQDFTALAPGQVTTGQSYPITLKGNTNGNFENYFTVFIDFNHNGNLNDAGESFNIGFITNSTGLDTQQLIGNIAIPSGALPGLTLMRVFKLFDSFTNSPCIASSVFGDSYGQVEDYLLNVTAPCATPAPTVTATQTFCSAGTVADLSATGTGTIVWYADATGGTPLAATTVLVNNETYYAAQIVGCESNTRALVTAVITTVAVDTYEDVIACNDYTLEAISLGNYFTEPDGEGDQLEAGDVINEDMTIYVYNVSGECTAESSFTVTINTVVVDDTAEDVSVCESYILPALTNGTYYTEPNGEGLELTAGDEIEENATIYIYAESGTTPNCAAEHSFTVTIIEVEDLTGAAEQAFETAGTIADLEVTGEDGAIISWYATEEDAEDGVNPLEETEALANGTYYASQLVGECRSDAFAVTVSIIILDVKGFNANAFSYYPNPVKDVLTLSYNNTITSVEVYNFLGQQIMAKAINQNEAKLDMSQFAAGTYLVKLNTENGSTAVKVLKQ